jgi:hypothetical protein
MTLALSEFLNAARRWRSSDSRSLVWLAFAAS